MFNFKRLFFFYASLLTFVLFFAACNSVNQSILMPSSMGYNMQSVEITKDSASIEAPEENQFVTALYDELEDIGLKKIGGEKLQIQYKITKYDAGSRAARFFLGFGSGSGKLVIDTHYMKDNNVLSKITTEVIYKGGTWGGNFDNAYYMAAEKIAEYVKEKFKTKK